jgi:hypothetical protein
MKIDSYIRLQINAHTNINKWEKVKSVLKSFIVFDQNTWQQDWLEVTPQWHELKGK